MLAVIMRAHNRLEYTIRSTMRLYETAAGNDWLHFVVDNASTDGTRDWFAWMRANSPTLNRTRYVRSNANLGCWGGFRLGAETVERRGLRPTGLVWLDNDILTPSMWDRVLGGCIEADPGSIYAFRRRGVKMVLESIGRRPPLTIQGVPGPLRMWRVAASCACFVVSPATFREHADKATKGSDLAKFIPTYKIIDRHAEHIEGWNGHAYPQLVKYPKPQAAKPATLRGSKCADNTV